LMSYEKVYVPAVTKKALALALIGIAISALMWPGKSLGVGSKPVPMIRYRFPYSTDEYWWEGGHYFQALLGCFSVGLAFIFVCGLVNYGASKGWWKIKFSGQELALIMALVPLGAIFGGSDYWNPWEQTTIIQGFVPGVVTDSSWWNLIPPVVFGPRSASVWSYCYVPGKPIKGTYMPWEIPWLAILPNMLIFWVFLMLMVICLMCASALMRYICIKTEYLAFPFNEVYGGIVNLAKIDEQTNRPGMFSKPFVIGFLVSFLWTFAFWGLDQWIMLFKGEIFDTWKGRLPDPRTWYPTDTLAWPAYDFTLLDLLDWSPLFFQTGLWEIGWASLIPINVLLSGLIGFVAIYVVLPPVWVYVANQTPMNPNTSAFEAIKRLQRGYTWGGLCTVPMFLGMCLAIIVAMIVNNWRESLIIFKSIVKEPFKEFDEDRPLPYRWLWWIMLGSFFLWFLMGIFVFQMMPIPLLLYGIFMVVTYLATGKIISESGGWLGFMQPNYFSALNFTGAMITYHFNLLPTGNLDTSTVTTLWYIARNRSINNWFEVVPWYTLYSLKMSESQNLRSRKMLLALIVGFALALIISPILYEIEVAYAPYSDARGRGIINLIKDNLSRGTIESTYQWTQYSRYTSISLQTVAISFAVILALSILQRYISFLRFLSIGGLITGVWVGYTMWASWIIALIIKIIVLRAGGTKMYEEKLRPLSLGFFAGGLIAFFLAQVGWMLK
ncbi:MAG: DUF6785 family protein, partial [Candidatus Bathyarchaeia archaeon]